MDFEGWKNLNEDAYNKYFNELLEERKYNQKTYKRIFTVLKRIGIFYRQNGDKVFYVPDMKNENHSEELLLKDYISNKEFNQLMEKIDENEGLSEKQMEVEGLLKNRNKLLFIMFYKYGLLTNELIRINLEDVNLIQGIIEIKNEENNLIRIIHLQKEDRILINKYLNDIPKMVRPRRHSKDPLFVALEFNLKTFCWSYKYNKPKRITIVSVQKIMRREIKRTNSKQATPSILRNSCIINQIMIMEGSSKSDWENIKYIFGMKSDMALLRYKRFIQKNKDNIMIS